MFYAVPWFTMHEMKCELTERRNERRDFFVVSCVVLCGAQNVCNACTALHWQVHEKRVGVHEWSQSSTRGRGRRGEKRGEGGRGAMPSGVGKKETEGKKKKKPRNSIVLLLTPAGMGHDDRLVRTLEARIYLCKPCTSVGWLVDWFGWLTRL